MNWKDRGKHLETLDKVLQRLEEAGMHMKERKCAFMLPAVEYLGHHISAEGLRPTKEKVGAIMEAPAPQDVTQLHAFLGLVNYYGKFVGQLSSILAPLYKLLVKKTKWNCRQTAFQRAKERPGADPGRGLREGPPLTPPWRYYPANVNTPSLTNHSTTGPPMDKQGLTFVQNSHSSASRLARRIRRRNDTL
jgi:hypothetical protein